MYSSIFKSVSFINEDTKIGNLSQYELTAIEKEKLKSNLEKARIRNKKIGEYSIHAANKSRYDEIKQIMGMEWSSNDPFNNKFLRIIVVTDKSGKEVAYYLHNPNNLELNETYFHTLNDNNIQDYIIASVEYKLGIKFYINRNFIK